MFNGILLRVQHGRGVIEQVQAQLFIVDPWAADCVSLKVATPPSRVAAAMDGSFAGVMLAIVAIVANRLAVNCEISPLRPLPFCKALL
ncbi:hypothetical protein [Janthinobacterium sp.]|uniref:hypothetical protein n=1 Tax=Janthinobacterium sp. TaxID=1871054 RepID=UPI002586BB2A|nr:hypothetical protein [Janthinobacterium sp.]MCX7291064.1 hypothetical protein [Janthinobacterium sp.]